MPVSLPTSEMEIHSIDAQLAINAPAIQRGIGVSNNPGNPLINSIAANGFFGVLVESQLPNLTGAVKAVQLPCCNRGITEVFVSAAVVRGAPLTLDAANNWVTAVAGQKVFGRAQRAGLANTYIPALIHNEGTL
jgi:hypothetical protein